MSALRILALSYLASASVFVVAATLAADPRISRQTMQGADVLVRMAQDALGPVLRLDPPSHIVRLTLAPSALAPPAPQERVADLDTGLSVTVLPDLSPESAPVPPLPEPPAPQMAQPRIPNAA